MKPLVALSLLLVCHSGQAARIEVDCAEPAGIIRPLHGGNCGPVQYGGMLDLSDLFRQLAPPLIRLHDCHWPNPDVVDIHAIFPDMKADPLQPGSFDFGRSDDYIQAIVNTGSGIVYRLGESIEHTPRKYHVHPPEDPHKWAAVCLGIIRHYNEGWADGAHHDIRYWEIWNEPENRPAMWTGNDEQYLELYECASRAIKSRWPELKVGGPSLGFTGQLTGDRFEPGEFLTRFLVRCRDRKLPLDFFSWHLYTANPRECVLRAKGIRQALDQHGFHSTELHLNEWNYLPGNDWAPMMLPGQGRARTDWFGQMQGAAGAAFTACVLSNLQDSPVDAANYYAFTHHGFGLFSPHGLPQKPYYAMLAFRSLLETPLRVGTSGSSPETSAVIAGLNRERNELRLLISNLALKDESILLQIAKLPWPGASRFELSVVDSTRSLEVVRSGEMEDACELGDVLKAPSLALLRVWPAGNGER